MPTYVLSNISYWEPGPKLFFEVNFAFFWKLSFSHCNSQYTVWSNYNGKNAKFTLKNNFGPCSHFSIAYVWKDICRQLLQKKILSTPMWGPGATENSLKQLFWNFRVHFTGKRCIADFLDFSIGFSILELGKKSYEELQE